MKIHLLLANACYRSWKLINPFKFIFLIKCHNLSVKIKMTDFFQLTSIIWSTEIPHHLIRLQVYIHFWVQRSHLKIQSSIDA